MMQKRPISGVLLIFGGYFAVGWRCRLVMTLAVQPAASIKSMPTRATGGSASLKKTTLMISAKGMTAN